MKGKQITFEEAVGILENDGKVVVEHNDNRYIATKEAYFRLTVIFNSSFYEYNEVIA